MALRNQILPAQMANQTARRLLAWDGNGVPELLQQFVATNGRLDLLDAAYTNDIFRIIRGTRLLGVNNISYVFGSGGTFDQPGVILCMVLWTTKSADNSQSSFAITAAAFRKQGVNPPVRLSTANLFSVDDIPGAVATYEINTDGTSITFDWNSNQVLVNHDVQPILIYTRMV
jgi:hypothetical protein